MPSERRAAEKPLPATTMGEVLVCFWVTVMLTMPVWPEMVLVTRTGTRP